MCIFFFFYFQLASLFRVVLQRECQISLKQKKCHLEFRKCRIKDCEWFKIPKKCGIKESKWWLWLRKCGTKECEFRAKFSFFNSAIFCVAWLFSALLSSFEVISRLLLYLFFQMHIQKPVKYLRWSVLWKYLTVFSTILDLAGFLICRPFSIVDSSVNP